MEFRRSLGVIESPVLLESLVWVHFLIWLRYHSMLAWYDRPVLEMVSLSFLELYLLLQIRMIALV